jgi:hypothetical protein
LKFHAPNWQLWIEMMVALYFLIDTTRTVYLWTARREEPESLKYSLIVDTIVFILGAGIDAIPFWTNMELLDAELEQAPSDLQLEEDVNKVPEKVVSQMV